tara:strand:- start:4618 stop:5373 length:756 start_codon:yes stop_codon:yes gene_type:complete
MPHNFYESDKAVSEYLLFHYGTHSDLLFDQMGPQEALGFAHRSGLLHEGQSIDRKRALDLGCAVGAASHALSESFSEVVGIDFSHALIQAANRISSSRKATIEIATEGDLTRRVQVSVPYNSQPGRITFTQGDAMNLNPELGKFDFILMANLIDRLPDPKKCLQNIHSFATEDGVLAITSPYTWLEEYTPKSKWLGGYEQNGIPIKTVDQLERILAPHFEKIDSQNLPFLIREHDRKNQYSVAHATLWRKC